jgi:hypothetical protein
MANKSAIWPSRLAIISVTALMFAAGVMLAFDESEKKMFRTVLLRLWLPSGPRPEAAV